MAVGKNTTFESLRIALVYDRINKWGGAERVLLALHDIFPTAPIYTSVYNSPSARWARVFPSVNPTFLQHIPGATSRHELFPWLTPMAFESINFDDFDVVISVTSADAKGIITKPHTFHLCYCLTPTRYLWSHESFYKSHVSLPFHNIFNYLKRWDKVASTRPDAYISISQVVQSRIHSYYNRSSDIVYPPVNTPKTLTSGTSDYFLYVSRLVPYKKPRLVVDLFNKLGLPLCVVGIGSESSALKQIAKSNIKFANFVSESNLASYYQNCKALVSTHEEDFGIVYAEAQMAGKPVLALDEGGVSEIIINGVTGILTPDIHDLEKAIKGFDNLHFDPQVIMQNGMRFSKERFQADFVKVSIRLWNRYKSTFMS